MTQTLNVPGDELVHFTKRGRKFHRAAPDLTCKSFRISRHDVAKNSAHEVEEQTADTAIRWGKTPCLECYGVPDDEA